MSIEKFTKIPGQEPSNPHEIFDSLQIKGKGKETVEELEETSSVSIEVGTQAGTPPDISLGMRWNKKEKNKNLQSFVIAPETPDDFLSVQWNKKKGKEKVETEKVIFKESKVETGLEEAYLIKAFRNDKWNFTRKAIKAITPSPRRKEFYRPRTKPKGIFTVDGRGVWKRSEKPPQYTPEEKEGFSMLNSTSLVVPNQAESPLFGHSKDRARKSIAIRISLKDVLLSYHLGLYDGGTVGRRYDKNSYEEALEYFSQRVLSDNPVLYAEIKPFLEALSKLKNSGCHNEVLARLRWNCDGSSKVCIGSDTLEARLLAQDCARLIKIEAKARAKDLKLPWDDQYEVPIVYYIPGDKKHDSVYNKEAQLADRKEAKAIYDDKEKRYDKYRKKDYEFLLGATNTSSILVEEIPIEKKPTYFSYLSSSKESKSLLLQIIQDGYVHIAQSLIEKDKERAYEKIKLDKAQVNEKINIQEDKNKKAFPYTALYYAAHSGAFDLVGWLLAKGADPNIRCGENGETVLHIAAQQGDIRTVILLLKEYPDLINIANKAGKTALDDAASFGHLQIVKFLLKKGKNKEVISQNRNKVFFFAAMNGRLEVVKALLEEGVDMELLYEDKNETLENIILYGGATGGTTLYWCVHHGRLDMAKFLIEKGADKRTTDTHQNTLLHLAACRGHLEIVKLLLKEDVDIKAINEDGKTALQLAKDEGHKEIEKILLEYLNQETYATSFFSSIKSNLFSNENKNAVIKQELILSPLDTRQELILSPLEEKKAEALWRASDKGLTNTVAQLLSQGANPHWVSYGGTALHVAAAKGYVDIVELLIEQGANKEAVTLNSETALHLAAKNGQLAVVKFLIARGANIRVINRFEGSVLHYVTVLEKEVDIEAINKDNKTALQLAQEKGHKEVEEILLEYQKKKADSISSSSTKSVEGTSTPFWEKEKKVAEEESKVEMNDVILSAEKKSSI